MFSLSQLRIYLNFKNFGFASFYIGLFLLPAVFSFSVIFLIIALFYGIFSYKKDFIKDKWNITLCFSTLLLITSSFLHSLGDFGSNSDWEKSLSWIGLMNWIPMFLCFWGFQIYLKSADDRKRCFSYLVAGSFPILASGIAQSFFGIYGPFKALGGLIIWYQRPINGFTELSAVFSNRNYAGSWFNIIFPFCVVCLIQNRKNIYKTFITFPLTVITFTSIVLTTSRAAWGGLFISIPLLIGLKSFIWLIPILILSFILIASTIYPIFGETIQLFLQTYIHIPQTINNKLTQIGFEGNIARLDIWNDAIQVIKNNPIFGTGSGSFPYILKESNKFVYWHTHNLPIEIALSYGLPVALILVTFTIILTFFSFKTIYFDKKYSSEILSERAWITSLTIIVISQLVDIQYFDGRISIISWIFLSGMRCILYKNE